MKVILPQIRFFNFFQLFIYCSSVAMLIFRYCLNMILTYPEGWTLTFSINTIYTVFHIAIYSHLTCYNLGKIRVVIPTIRDEKFPREKKFFFFLFIKIFCPNTKISILQLGTYKEVVRRIFNIRNIFQLWYRQP